VIHYRAFLNGDPPRLAEIWRGCAGRGGLAQPISTAMIEQIVLAKQYFDREGVVLAFDDDRPIGFAHAGFGPNETETSLSTDLGVTLLVLVVPHPDQQAVSARLLERSEEYLRRRGAKVLYGGGIRPLNPFYWGLYGGSEPPGVLDSDGESQALFTAHAYREIDRTVVLHRDLASFRPLVDRQQMQIRRGADVEVIADPPAASWWDACVMSPYDRIQFRLRPRNAAEPIASAVFWNMEPLATGRGVRTGGLIDVQVAPPFQRQGYATYLLGEAMRQLQDEGFAAIEAQTMIHNAASLAMYRKLGFQQADSGAVYRKEGG
jgi:GNAT superfamily N-acetyltransferase